MDILNIFDGDAFSVMTLTDAMREIKFAPSYLSSTGLFRVSNIDSLMIGIEKDKEQNQMILTALPRGGAGQTFTKNRRNVRNLTLPHYQVDDAILADEVQQVRAFGDAYARETLAGKIADRAAEVSNFFALTEEAQRLQIIKDGTLTDGSGTVLFDYFSEMEETQETAINFDLDNASPAEGALRTACTGLRRLMAEKLDGLPFSGITALVGDTFFDQLVAHPEVRETYKGFADARALRSAFGQGGMSAIHGQFDFGDITWINYRGITGATIEATAAHFFPTGVPGLFRTVYGPADYMETVNRPGQRLYAMQQRMRNNKGVELEFQSNPLHYCTRPRVLIPGINT